MMPAFIAFPSTNRFIVSIILARPLLLPPSFRSVLLTSFLPCFIAPLTEDPPSHLKDNGEESNLEPDNHKLTVKVRPQQTDRIIKRQRSDHINGGFAALVCATGTHKSASEGNLIWD